MDTSFLQNKSTFAAVVGGIAIVGALVVATVLGASTAEMGLSVVGGLVTTGIVAGIYLVGRRAGHPHSHAVAEASVGFGVLYILVLVFRLLSEFGTRSPSEVYTGMGAVVVGAVLVVAVTVALGRVGPSPGEGA